MAELISRRVMDAGRWSMDWLNLPKYEYEEIR